MKGYKGYQWLKGYKYQLCSKGVETETIFTMTDIINEWNGNILYNTSYVQKVSRVKLKLSMVERLILIKILAMFKKHWAVFIKTEIINERNYNFLYNISYV